ncbi:DUF4242 domain-containing protein [Mangrovimonas aestuarii]|uniref:DUF4242 domain-containing protein n=1 Tax=Mangrovimonas aestuarii TaxID=3018443 RepID=UPI00237857CF|nr:DUF4242 domain-containing protein [Mangrovimonas aestuarii]
MKTIQLFVILLFFVSGSTFSQSNSKSENSAPEMKTYVIERSIPGAGDLTEEELKNISKTSCAVLDKMGPKIVWMHSYVTNDKVYCVYQAESKELVLEHAKKGGFPANSVEEVAVVISPETAKD